MVLNESGKREEQFVCPPGQFLGRRRSRDPLPDLSVSPSVSPSVSTRFVELSNLDLGCGEKGKEKGASKKKEARKSSRSFREFRR